MRRAFYALIRSIIIQTYTGCPTAVCFATIIKETPCRNYFFSAFFLKNLTIELTRLVSLLVGILLSSFWLQFNEVVDTQNCNCSLGGEFQTFYLKNNQNKLVKTLYGKRSITFIQKIGLITARVLKI